MCGLLTYYYLTLHGLHPLPNFKIMTLNPCCLGSAKSSLPLGQGLTYIYLSVLMLRHFASATSSLIPPQFSSVFSKDPIKLYRCLYKHSSLITHCPDDIQWVHRFIGLHQTSSSFHQNQHTRSSNSRTTVHNNRIHGTRTCTSDLKRAVIVN